MLKIMLKKYNYLSKLDRILLLFFILNNEWSPLEVWKIFVSINKEIHDDISQAKRPLLYQMFIHFFVGAMQLAIFPILYSLILIIYLVVSFLTLVPSLILIISLAIYYGFFPFLLNTTEETILESTKKLITLKGYHKLKTPIYRNWTILLENSKLLQKTGLAPIHKFKELDFRLKTNIIEQISLVLGSFISMVFYSGLLFAVIDIILFIPLVLMTAILGVTWVIVHFVVTMMERLKTTSNE